MLFYLKAANSDVDLTAALVWTVEHLEHPVCFDDGTSPVSLRPDAAKTHAVDLTRGQQEEQISAVQHRPYILLNVSEWDPNSPCRVVSAHLLRLRCSSRSLPSSRASTLGCSSCLSLKPAEKRCENWFKKMARAGIGWIKNVHLPYFKNGYLSHEWSLKGDQAERGQYAL